jgi:hypothetical protein
MSNSAKGMDRADTSSQNRLHERNRETDRRQWRTCRRGHTHPGWLSGEGFRRSVGIWAVGVTPYGTLAPMMLSERQLVRTITTRRARIEYKCFWLTCYLPSSAPSHSRSIIVYLSSRVTQAGVLEGDHKWRISPARRGKGKPKEVKAEGDE